MAMQLPDIKSRVVIDDSQLKTAGVSATKTGSAIEAGLSKGKASLGQFSSALAGVMGQAGLGGMPVAAVRAGESLEGMGSKGIGAMTLLGGAAIAGGAIIAAAVDQSISAYTNLGDKVENFRRVTGASAEESSRMVEAFQALGVDAGTASAGIFKLSKAVESHSATLAADGIVVARTAAGGVDLQNTLNNVADAYNATTDAGKKNKIVFDAFGKSGKDMIPILEVGSAGLKAYEDSAGKVFSQADLDKLKAYEIHAREMNQQWEDMKANLGQNFIPLLDAFAQSVNEGAYVAQKQAAATGDVTRTNSGAINTYKGFSAETLKATNAIQEQWQEQEHLKDVMARVTQAAQDEAQAEKDDAAQIKAVTDAVKGQDGANLSLLQSEKAVLGDVTSLKTAHQHYLEVVKQYGPNSAAAKAALLDYNIALAQQKDDLDKVVIAAGAKAAADDIAKGKTDTAKDSAAAMVLELEDLEKTVKPGSALYKHYQDWIKLLQDTPVSIETTVGVQFNRAGGGAKAPKAFAAGGPSPVGEAFWVGEKGPELLTLDRPGWVTPHGAARPPAAGVALSAALYSGGAAAPPAWPAAAQAMAPTAAGSALESGADPTIARLLADIERNTEASAAAAREATAHLADISGAPRLSGTAAASRHG